MIIAAFLSTISGLLCIAPALCTNNDCPVDREQEDLEQIQYLREWQRKKEEKQRGHKKMTEGV